MLYFVKFNNYGLVLNFKTFQKPMLSLQTEYTWDHNVYFLLLLFFGNKYEEEANQIQPKLFISRKYKQYKHTYNNCLTSQLKSGMSRFSNNLQFTQFKLILTQHKISNCQNIVSQDYEPIYFLSNIWNQVAYIVYDFETSFH